MTRRSRDLTELRSEIHELFADMWQVPGYSGRPRRFRPQCDCFRTDDPPELHVVVELPGTDADSVRIAVSGGSLVIAGRRARPSVPRARYEQMEIEYGDFERRIELGIDVDPSGATATYERGMLSIVLPLESA